MRCLLILSVLFWSTLLLAGEESFFRVGINVLENSEIVSSSGLLVLEGEPGSIAYIDKDLDGNVIREEIKEVLVREVDSYDSFLGSIALDLKFTRIQANPPQRVSFHGILWLADGKTAHIPEGDIGGDDTLSLDVTVSSVSSFPPSDQEP